MYGLVGGLTKKVPSKRPAILPSALLNADSIPHSEPEQVPEV